MIRENGQAATPTWIPDGYTMTSYIAVDPRNHGAVRFIYRPFGVLPREALVRGQRGAKYEEVCAEAIRLRVLEWDVRHPINGQAIAIETPQILQLHPRIFTRMVKIITGDEGGDPDPGRDDSEIAADAEVELQAILAGEPEKTALVGN